MRNLPMITKRLDLECGKTIIWILISIWGLGSQINPTFGKDALLHESQTYILRKVHRVLKNRWLHL